MENFLAPWRPQLLSVLRIMAGLMLTAHGTAKYLAYPTHPFNKVVWNTPSGYAGLFELILGPLLVIGLLTRPVAFILSGLCAVAYFGWHAMPRGFHPLVNGGELAALYSFVFIYICAAGPGPWSVDAAMRNKP
jgi:putative oxidoreductase